MTKLVLEYKGYKNQIEAELDWLALANNREDTYGIQYTRGELCDYIKHHRGYLSRGDIRKAVSKFLPTYESCLIDSAFNESERYGFYLIIREYNDSWEGWIKDNVKPYAKEVAEHGVDSGQISSLIYTWEVLEVLSQYEDGIVRTIQDYLEETGQEITLKSEDFESFDNLMTKLIYTATEIKAQNSIYLEELDNYDCEDDDDDCEDDWEGIED